MAMRHTCDVAVIGAGLSGLYTARLLAAAGADVLVVEAQSRVGGRTLTVHFGDGTFVDDGGQWVSPGQPCIVRLADELGIQSAVSELVRRSDCALARRCACGVEWSFPARGRQGGCRGA